MRTLQLKIHSYLLAAIRLFASKGFFYFILALLVLQASWLALSGRYPMAFDENFHVGLIEIYSHKILPFFSSQPVGGDEFGAVARDPSYLYHYLMSFPYRFLQLFTNDEQSIVTLLRFINIALFTTGIVLYRKLLLRAKATPAIAHVILFFLVLIPSVPFLAAQINYDNLLFMLIALILICGLKLIEDIQKNTLSLKYVTAVIVLCLLATLVKYAFAPIMLAIFLFIAVIFIMKKSDSKKKLLKILISDWRAYGVVTKFGLIALIVVSSGMFVERYGVNFVQYKNPVPDCSKVLSQEQCMQYSVWSRNYEYERLPKPDEYEYISNPINFTREWLFSFFRSSFFAIDQNYQVTEPLYVPIRTAKAIAYISFILLLVFGWRLLRSNTALLFFFVIFSVYAFSLWYKNYTDYLHLGILTAIHGRYLFLLLIPALFIIAMLILTALKKANLRLVSPVLVLVVALLMTQGGGIITYILSSNETWYWPNQAIIDLNNNAREVLQTIVLDETRMPLNPPAGSFDKP